MSAEIVGIACVVLLMMTLTAVERELKREIARLEGVIEIALTRTDTLRARLDALEADRDRSNQP